MKDAEKTIGNMIDKQTVSFIASIDEDGFPNMKAMLQPRKREGIKIIYFTTNTSSMRVVQYRKNDHASVYFCDRRFFRGVMLRGTMEVLTDSTSKEMIWREGDTMYYPEGVTVNSNRKISWWNKKQAFSYTSVCNIPSGNERPFSENGCLFFRVHL